MKLTGESIYYVYAYFDPFKKGEYNYEEFKFDYEPFYIGKGKGNRLNIHLNENEKCSNKHKYYKIKLSGDNTDCPSLSSSQIVFRSKDCQEYSVSDPTIIKNPIVAPNPGNGARTLTFELTSQANVNIYVVNGTTGNIASQVVNNFGFLPGIQTVSIGEESLPIGQHYITITAGSNIISLPFTKQ